MRHWKFLSSWLIIGCTIPVLAFVAWNQFNWLQVLTNREQKRVEANMVAAAADISEKLVREILLLPGLINRNQNAESDVKAFFRQQFHTWKVNASVPEILTAAYLVDMHENEAWRYADGSFVRAELPRPPEKSELAARRPGPVEDDDDGLRVRVPLDIGPVPRYELVCSYDKQAIFRKLIPTIARDSLRSNDLYACRIVDTRDGTVLYASHFAKDSDFDKPDFKMPLLHTSSPRYATDMPSVDIPMDVPGEPSRRRDDGRFFFAKDFFPYLEIQIVNRQESFASMSRNSTRQNAIISFGIVALLALAMIILAEATRKASQLARKQQEFVATVTHELKTPLAVISSAAQNLADGLVRDESKAIMYGEMIAKEASRLGISIEHFLLYSNTGSEARIQPETCEIGDLVGTALAFTEQERGEMDFRTETLLPDHPVFVSGDRVGLESVFRNLAENAVRHARAGRYLSIIVTEEKGRNPQRGFVVVKVRDKGPGISLKEQKTVFEPFVRGKYAMAEQIPGNGIGLNLVRRIVNAHGGVIAVESKLGQGSTFIVKLPQGEGDKDGNQDSDDRG